MTDMTYLQRRGEIETYFDRTAADAWARLTSDAPVSRIRATVRAGRDRMRATLLGWLPEDLGARRVLDAGCGTGMLSLEMARRGAHVVAIDLSPNLIERARERTPAILGGGAVDFRVGDMLDPALGEFDHVVAMDSLIHYALEDAVTVLAGLAGRTRCSMLFTFAPKTPALTVMHSVGRLIPHREHRAPAIVPVGERSLRRRIEVEEGLEGWRARSTERVASGFYTSQAMELCRC
jgi:magnesium-protoporphyrin O-methyltransferase